MASVLGNHLSHPQIITRRLTTTAQESEEKKQKIGENANQIVIHPEADSPRNSNSGTQLSGQTAPKSSRTQRRSKKKKSD